MRKQLKGLNLSSTVTLTKKKAIVRTKGTRDNRIDLSPGIMSSLSRGKGYMNAKYLFIQRQ